MSKAEAMFKILKFKKEDLVSMYGNVWGERYVKAEKEIWFDYVDKDVMVCYEDGQAVYFDMKELKAINKRVKELKWGGWKNF